MKLMYIAGRYSGKTYSEIDDNIKKAKQEALRVIKKGWFPVTPHLNTAHFEEWEDFLGVDYHFWIEGDLEILKKCDAVYFTPDWEESSGCKIEREFANENDILIYLDYKHIPDLTIN